MKFLIFPDAAGEWRWHLVAGNNRLVATSGESFYDQHNALRAAQTVYSGITDMALGGAFVIAPEARNVEDAATWGIAQV